MSCLKSEQRSDIALLLERPLGHSEVRTYADLLHQPTYKRSLWEAVEALADRLFWEEHGDWSTPC